MKIPFKPISRLGKLSAWLILFAVLTFFTLYALAELLDVLPTIVVSVFGPAAVLAAIAACVTGLIALFKRGDRSIGVFAAVVIGGIAIFFIAYSMIEDLVR